jgi:hypothetical protein
MTEPAEDLALLFQAERAGDKVRVGLSALGDDGQVAIGLSGEIDLPTARLWLEFFEAAVGSARARTLAGVSR